MSALSNKILSYSPEVYYRFNQAYTTTPTNLGSTGSTTFSLSNEAPTLNSTGGIHGDGSWVFNSGNGTNDTSTTAFRNFQSASYSNANLQFTDNDFSIGFWFKTNYTLNNSLAHAALFTIGQFGGSSTTRTVSFGLSGGSANAANKGKLVINTTGGTTIYSSSRIDDQQWHYIAAIGTFSSPNLSYAVYLDGTYLGTTTPSTTTGGLTYTQFQISTMSGMQTEMTTSEYSDYYAAPSSVINATAISEIWTAGSTSGSTNITITETPATASALQTEPSITTSVNFIETPATSSALIVDPTVVIQTPDYTEITTSILVSAEFLLNISVYASQNINLQITALMEASTELINNVIIDTGTDASISSTEFIASAEFIDPIIAYAPMTASALMTTANVYVTPSYFKLVKQSNPLFYSNFDSSTLINYGSWGTNFNATAGSTISKNVDSTLNMGLVGAGKSWQFTGNYYNAPNYIRFYGPDTATMASLLTGTFTVEYWFKKLSTNNAGIGLDCGNIELSYTPTTGSYEKADSFVVKITNLEPGTGNWPISSVNPRTQSRYYGAANSMVDNQWNHVVLQSTGSTFSLSVNGSTILTGSFSQNGTWYNSYITNPVYLSIRSSQWDNSQDAEASTQSALALFDELAIYNTSLSNSAVIDHFSFINNLDPSPTIYPVPFEATLESGDHQFIVNSNVNAIAIPITASSLIVDPIIIASKNINYLASTLDASANNTNVSVYFGRTINATSATASALQPESYCLNNIYYNYIKTNINPYRYVSFDHANPYLDFGTDNDYSVIPTIVGGTIVNPDLAINGKSAKTAGLSYITDGVILKESEHDDNWGTGNNSWHSSFWMEQALDDTSTGLRVLWNLNGAYDNQNIILYHYQNKLHLQINNQVEAPITITSANNINLFNLTRHHIVINSHHNNNNNYIYIYVDGALVLDQNIGSYAVTTINNPIHVGANDEANNFARLGVGCLITPFGYTALPVVPTNTRLIIDEVYWDKNQILQAQVTDVYNVMPDKDNSNIAVVPFLASDDFLMPTISTNAIYFANAMTVSAELVNPNLYIERFITNVVDPMNASALMTTAIAFQNAIINSDVMIASSIFNDAGIIISIPGGPMIATIKLQYNKIYLLTATNAGVLQYVVPRLQVSPWAKYLRGQDGTSKFAQVLGGMKEIK